MTKIDIILSLLSVWAIGMAVLAVVLNTRVNSLARYVGTLQKCTSLLIEESLTRQLKGSTSIEEVDK
jgi:hypothetical protein